MMRKVGAGFLLVLLPVLGACANSQDEAKSTSSNNAEGVDVEAQQDVWVMSTPGGDVSEGILAQGQTATAVCFLRDIRTSAGFTGNAVKIKTADISGYAFVTDFPTDSADRKMMLSPDEDALGDRLPSCTH